MLDRAYEYKHKCLILKQIQSNKALFYRRCNSFQHIITILISSFITFIGFSGMENINLTINKLFNTTSSDIFYVQVAYNILVFALFLNVIFHLVFQITQKQSNSEKAISSLASLINEIDDICRSNQSINAIEIIRYKYTTLINTIPSNTDKEFEEAKKSFAEKEIKTNYSFIKEMYLDTYDKQLDFLKKSVLSDNTLNKILDILAREDKRLYLGGGVIRNMIWDKLHGFKEKTPIDDIDVVYFDMRHKDKCYDQDIEDRLFKEMPNYKWSVKNQARMNVINDDEPYLDIHDAISKWPDTASAIIMKKVSADEYEVIAPHKLDDLFRLVVHPTPHFMDKIERYQQRVVSHEWGKKWNKLRMFHID